MLSATLAKALPRVRLRNFLPDIEIEKGSPHCALNLSHQSSRRLLIVSNRLPVSLVDEKGAWMMKDSAGGLATGLRSYFNSARHSTASIQNTAESFFLLPPPQNHLWIGWPGTAISAECHHEVSAALTQACNARPVFLDGATADRHYGGFCNDTIWPLFHYFTNYTKYEPDSWAAYIRANEAFCEQVLAEYRDGDTIWIHDYHLMLLPRMLRKKLPNAQIGFFLHIPFPAYEVFRLLPRDWSNAILDGLLGADLVGFHTTDYATHFGQSVEQALGVKSSNDTVTYRERKTALGAFPMGIDFDGFAQAAAHPCGLAEWENLTTLLDGKKAILSVDRLDYTKGILQRLEAFELFLNDHPEWHGRVVLLAVVVPSREEIETYDEMRRRIEQAVGAINGRHGRLGWTPIIYQYRQLALQPLAAAYAAADVALVTPLRDGMNLVAKEFVASCIDETGVLVLSELAGAAAELTEALLVNPNNLQEMADAIRTALEMKPAEQRRRLRIMQQRLKSYNVVRWVEDFLSSLNEVSPVPLRVASTIMAADAREELLEAYCKAKRRLIITDYDGTLVGFHPDPQLARPTARVLEILAGLQGDSANLVALISGRVPETLESWFGHIGIALAAEHGGFIREKHETNDAEQRWRPLESPGLSWKDEIRPVMKAAADQILGAFVEEKHLSLAWHWRAADSSSGTRYAAELEEVLKELLKTRNDLQLLRGNKVLEVRSSRVNKGHATQYFMKSIKPDFIIAAGDDQTDEDIFRALPASAWTIKVGHAQTAARFVVKCHDDVVALFEELQKS